MNIRDWFNRDQIGLNTEREGYVIEEGLPAQRGIFETDRRTQMDRVNGPVTQKVGKFHRLDCGCVARDMKEVLGRCMKCNENWICIKCGVKCSRCLKLLCPSCTRLVDGVAYCGSCRRVLWFKKHSISGIRKLHNGLSKKI